MRPVFLLASFLWLWLVPATLAAGVIALFVLITGGHWAWYVWVLLSPLLYFVWLISFLLFCAPLNARRGRRFPKPKLATQDRHDSGLITVAAMRMRSSLVNSLPIVGVLEQTEIGRRLVMRSCSPSIHIGKKTHIGGTLWDPDLTYVGDFVTIGAKTEIGAHLWIPTPSGKLMFVTAPVKIGAYAFIGGGVSISLGCNIGEHAMIEPLSYLPPHTSVPSGEVWGGNPASFKRKRSSTVTTSPGNGD